MALTLRQQKFVEIYAGNGTQACRDAGYAGSDATLATQAKVNLRLPHIKAALRKRDACETKKRIATREERQSFWTDVMGDEGQEINARLKASELLGRSQTDFIEKRELEHRGTINVIDPYAKPGGGS